MIMVRLIGGLGAELGENDEVDGVSRALGPDQLVRATSPAGAGGCWDRTAVERALRYNERRRSAAD